MKSIPEARLAIEDILKRLGLNYRLKKYGNKLDPDIFVYPPKGHINPADDWEDTFGCTAIFQIGFWNSICDITEFRLSQRSNLNFVLATWSVIYPWLPPQPTDFLSRVEAIIRSAIDSPSVGKTERKV